MGREKVRLIAAFTGMGFDVLISDVDTVWMRDFREFLPVCPECDILSSSDCLTTATKVRGVDRPGRGVCRGCSSRSHAHLFRAL